MTDRAWRGYVDVDGGQLHYRLWGEPTGLPDLYLLHPAPYSGLAWSTVAAMLARRRRVIAPDYPGHGGSDALSDRPSIAEYAGAMRHVSATVSGAGPVAVVGFHSGCLVAADWLWQAATELCAVVLIDVPLFTDEQCREFTRATTPPPLTDDMDCVADAWQRTMVARRDKESRARSLSLFVESLRGGEARGAGFQAAFAYPAEARLAQLSGSVGVIATRSSLLAPTRRAAALIPGARLIQLEDSVPTALELCAEQSAAAIEQMLAELGASQALVSCCFRCCNAPLQPHRSRACRRPSR